MPPQGHPSYHIGAYVAILAALLVVIGIVYVFSTSPLPRSNTVEETPLAMAEKTAPQPTASDLVIAQKGFDYLVSYNGTAFIPLRFAAESGEVIRFTNNSARSVQITITPATAASPMLARGEYWEYTIPITAAKELFYKANGAAGTVTIK